MRYAALGSVAALIAGVALVAYSVAEGEASVFLLVVIPAVSGSSLPFVLGVALLIVGFFSLPFTLAMEWDEEPTSSLASPSNSPPPTSAQGAAGGFVLIGPVPIVFGTWKGVSRRTRWLLAFAGGVLFTFAIVAVLVLFR
jgi:uncharacterized protein (TIGR00304 family)